MGKRINHNKIKLILISLLLMGLVACGPRQIKSSIPKAGQSKTRQDQVASNYQAIGVDGKVSLGVRVKNGEMHIEIQNLVPDNVLASAYLEYIRTDGDKSYDPVPLDADMINLSGGASSDTLVYVPQKTVGKEGFVQVKALVYKNSIDDYVLTHGDQG